MPPSIPFIDPETRGLRTAQIRDESYRVAGLIALFGGVALVPFVLGIAFDTGISLLFVLLTQFVIAIGTAVVLMYVVARGVQLADAAETRQTRPVETDDG